MEKIPAIFAWSGGKDSSYALHKILQEGIYDVKYLLSTINGTYKRLSMHGIKEELIEAQADRIGIPLLKVYVYEDNNAEYEAQMEKMLLKVKEENIHHVIFGDIFLEDLRKYREEKMAAINMKCVFPLWKIDTKWLVNDFIHQGFKTVICCVNDAYLDQSWCDRIIDKKFLEDLPNTVDPCGENGEFHSFCFSAPIFKQAIAFLPNEKVYKPLKIKKEDITCPIPNTETPTKGFWYSDLILI